MQNLKKELSIVFEKYNGRGFTLIELVVVAGIILLLSAIILPNYRIGERQFALQRSAHKLAQDLRKAQEMAMSAKEFEGIIPMGYGVFLKDTEPSHYLLFADLNDNQEYDLWDGVVEDVSLEKDIEITELRSGSPPSLSSFLSIVFIPPHPIIAIEPNHPAIITLENSLGNSKIINVNKVGLIDIE